MQDTELQTDIQRIAECGPIRVWSLVVTIMGDLCQSPDTCIPGKTLGDLVGRLGITNQALRVALHRLRRDGWIQTVREGRTSNYFLSDRGRELTLAVRDQIYHPAPPTDTTVWLVMAPQTMPANDFSENLPDESVALSPRVALIAEKPDPSEDYLILPFAPHTLPQWAALAVAPEELQREFSDLRDAVALVLDRPDPASLTDRTALRLVILHHWRRLVLRQSGLADLVLPADWPGTLARDSVQAALKRYPRPDPEALNRECGQETRF
ncbi:PaaX family transcriptional regulator C-terminal domain-containing protein [Thiosulfatihalobacter marinus]|uniref:PaaX family transcriptional regulator C-terminal domain-containing protein n=1 Tax=Thiosulfatihalobacter marinus TaxID=2792481 RepID=UPI0018D7A060|nr:PaaX family transcriptional regulator C-terminal domain-containing protein [Thiosulfatihalobacter marinus]